MKIIGIAHLTLHAGMYVLFGADGHLYRTQADGSPVSVAHLPCISTEKQIRLYIHEPWVCVTERFGTHAALVHLENASVRELNREDYHADVSSYSIGFLERDGRVLLIHQTAWNRLDITDATTGECLTEREVYQRFIEPGYRNNAGEWIPPNEQKKNYIDYFHSLLHVSPDGECFLSNGWIWNPIGQILCFHTGDFLRYYEPSGISIEHVSDYNWDRPCTFIGNDRFVIAADDMRKSGLLEPDDLNGYVYKQFQFYYINMLVVENAHWGSILMHEREASCDVFTPDEEGYVHGKLVWDATYEFLAAVTPDGAFAIGMDGEVLESLPECKYTKDDPFADFNSTQNFDLGWHYSPEHHRMYHWSQEADALEERRFGIGGGSSPSDSLFASGSV